MWRYENSSAFGDSAAMITPCTWNEKWHKNTQNQCGVCMYVLFLHVRCGCAGLFLYVAQVNERKPVCVC
jgi:hypothetical protein